MVLMKVRSIHPSRLKALIAILLRPHDIDLGVIGAIKIVELGF
jgi:hypothetical protein